MAVFLQPTFPQVNGYRLTKKLYRARNTAVYRGISDAQQRPVVIKLLCSETPSIRELVKFRNQYMVTRNLSITGVVKPLALNPWGNGYALVMEDFGGVALGNYVREHIQESGLPWQEVVAIALQVTGILHELHQARVIHKDIKPANLLIHPETQQIQLIDFGIASLLPKETQELQSPNALEGTLAYMAPEQTGRMNRGIDYRVDFYSLGVNLYELLTGQLPFSSNDPIELLHCHIAKAPLPPAAPTPPPLSDIVLKLMAKNVENRYQSALGLKHDLQQCLNQWEASGQVERFELGQRDVSERFLIPETLYGRETEVQTLLDAFDRVSQGGSELMLVAGFSGIGKTAVVNEVHKPIVKNRGYFIKGKFDQLNRNIPFSAFVQAFRDLMGQLLGESEDQLQIWKAQMLQALGESGQVLIDVIPELEAIIGPQPAVPELSGSAAQNRFNLLFEKFIAVFTTAAHPLVMFLDDLQWVDSASLGLLKLLMGNNRSGYLLLLGAYRDNEVFPAHPLMLTLGELTQQDTNEDKNIAEIAEIATITLAPLSTRHINQLVSETLSCTAKLATPLTEIVYQKTAGNPFFTIQFLKGLYKDGLITFDRDLGAWECDLVSVQDAALSNDVVAFMVNRLHRLPDETQNALKLAACIGNQFDLQTLATISETRSEEIAAHLWTALQEGLILPQSQAYKFFQGWNENVETTEDLAVGYRFLHDRVQQASYNLIEEDHKQTTHLNIGRLLRLKLSEEEREKNLFKIVNQLNIGRTLIEQLQEIEDLAQLNFEVAQKAKSAAAYHVAASYLNIAIELLQTVAVSGAISAVPWHSHYGLMLALHNLLAEVSYLNGEYDASQQQTQTVIDQAQDYLDQVKAYEIRISLSVARGQCQEALDVGLEILSLLDVSLDDAALPNIDIDSLYRLPEITSPKITAALSILSKLWAPALIAGSELLPKVILTMLNLSVTYGNSAIGAFAYSLYGMLLCAQMTDIELGYRFGQLALRTLERYEDAELTCKVNQLFHAFIRNWKELARDRVECLADNVITGLEMGDIEFACYGSINYCDNLFLIGESLNITHQKQTYYIELAKSLQQPMQHATLCSWGQMVDNLIGIADEPKRLVGSRFDESEQIPKLQESGVGSTLFFVYTSKTILNYLFNDYEQVLFHSQLAIEYEQAGEGMLPITQISLYRSLGLLALYPTFDLDRQAQSLDEVDNHQQRLRIWATHAPMNHQHKVDLVAAEKCRVLGQKLEAIELYERAIAGAKANKYLHEEALANELIGKFYLDWGKTKIAAVYMQEAYNCYERWGAKAKKEDLATRYADLLQPMLRQTQTIDPLETLDSSAPLNLSVHSSSSGEQNAKLDFNSALDLATILKSARALSESLDLSELLEKLAPMMLQISGAERLVLLLPDEAGDTWQVRLLATAETTQLVAESPTSNANLPIQLLQYVQRTQEVLVLDGPASSLPLVDPYLEANPPCSLLCLPLLHQGKLNGVLYLEHCSMAGVFTRDRITILNFLSTQAAISLENALLNQALEQKLDVQTTKLQASEIQFSQLVENIPGVIFQARVSPEEGAVLSYISPDCIDLYEVPAGAFLSGQYTLRDFEHSEDRADIDDALPEVNQMLLPFDREFRIITPSGCLKYIQVFSRPTVQPDGSNLWDGVILDISDRKTAELALQESQAKFRRMTENVPGMIYRHILHPDGSDELANVSAQVLDIFEVAPETALQNLDALWDRNHPDDLPKVMANVQASAQTLQPFYSEHRLILPKKGLRWIQAFARPARLDNGDIMWDGVIIDITDRKATELALQASETRFSHMVDNVPGVVFQSHTTQDGSIVFPYVSAKCHDLYEVSAEAIMSGQCNFRDFEHSEDRPIIDQRMAEVISAVQTFDHEFRIVTPSGIVKWVHLVTQPTSTLPDGIIIWDGLIMDVSDRKNAELALQESQSQFRRMAENVPGMIFRYVRHADGQEDELTYVSAQVKELFEVELEDALQNTLAHRVHPDDVSRVNQAIEDSVTTLITPDLIYRVVLPEKGIRWIKHFASVERLSNGDTVWEGILVDISDRKAAELALEQEALRRSIVFNTIPDGLHILDQQGNLLEANTRFFNNLGYTPEEGQHLKIFDWDAKYSQAELQAKLDTPSSEFVNQIVVDETLHRRKDGSIFPVEITIGTMKWNGQFSYICIARDVSDRKQAEAALAESEAKFRGLVEGVSDVIWSANVDQTLTYLSPQFQTLFGLNPADWLGKTPFDLVHPDDQENIQASAISSSQEDQKLVNQEFRHLCQDGSYVWVMVNAAPIVDAEGHVIKHQGVIRDISDRKQAEAALAESEAKFRGLVEGANDVIWSADLDGNFIYLSPQFQSIFGLDPTEWIGKPSFELMHPDDRPTIQELAENLNSGEGGKIANREFRHICQDGSYVWVMVNAVPIYDAEGRVIRHQGIVRDISDRKAAELALKQEILRRDSIFNTSSDGIHILDIEANLLEANVSFYQMIGYTSEEAKHLNAGDWDAKLSRETIKSNLQNFLQMEASVRKVDTLHRRKNGSVFPVEIYICPMEWEGQVSFICIARDISERKRAEAELQRTNEELSRATRLKGEFLANMSHELRTPLNSVIGFSQLMQRDISLSEKHKETLKTINRSGEYLLSLIEDILEMSKIEAGRSTLDLEPVNLPQLLNELKEMMQLKADAKHLSFEFSYAANIPDYIQADQVKLRQILLNLLSNALKFTSQGQVTFQAEVLTSQTADSTDKVDLKFSITDTGPGISADSQKIIFQPFIQASAGKHSHQGTGLGLPISQKFAAMMGGHISVESIEGHGSTFHCEICVERVSSNPLPETQSPQNYLHIRGIKDPRVNHRLLIVDDNPDNRSLLTQMLSIPGFEIATAANGVEAIEWNEHWQPALIWMDIRMPVMDGLEAVRQIRKIVDDKPRHQPKIIAITANAFAKEQEAALAAGCDDFLSKPFTASVVFERLERWLGIEFMVESDPEAKVDDVPTSQTQYPQTQYNEILIQESLQAMSTDWQLAFKQAVQSLNNETVDLLLTEVPAEHQAMVKLVKALQENYRYDVLVSFVEKMLV